MAIQIKNSQKELEKKAHNYKILFENNPMPMWIVNNRLTMVDVNQAALTHYGYTRVEFLQLHLKDIKATENTDIHISRVNKGKNEFEPGIWMHKRKDGTVIMVDTMTDAIIYQDQAATIILANDVTEKLKAEAELVRHRVLQQKLITEVTIQAQERQREEIGKELHDNINQILASSKLYLEIARKSDKLMSEEAIAKSYDSIILAINEIRLLSKHLVPPPLDNSLMDTVKQLTDELLIITDISFHLSFSRLNENLLNENMKLMFYRIIQEQVNNILKYARAGNVTIDLRIESANVCLSVIDDGIGFDITEKSNGIGLRNIDSRVRFYNGTASITSSVGNGCKLEISVPLEQQIKVAV